MISLLPKNTTPLERALEEAFNRFDNPVTIPDLWNADTCPENMLPWLACALSVDDWEPDWPTEKKRQACKESIQIHEEKGTPSAIKRALAVRGHPDAILIERSDFHHHDGEIIRDGSQFRGGESQWATFRIILQRAISIDQAAAIRKTINGAKRNCCHLVTMDFSATALRHNGFAMRNGTYTRGYIN